MSQCCATFGTSRLHHCNAQRFSAPCSASAERHWAEDCPQLQLRGLVGKTAAGKSCIFCTSVCAGGDGQTLFGVFVVLWLKPRACCLPVSRDGHGLVGHFHCRAVVSLMSELVAILQVGVVMSSLGILMLSTFNFLQASSHGCKAYRKVSGCHAVGSKCTVLPTCVPPGSCCCGISAVVDDCAQLQSGWAVCG